MRLFGAWRSWEEAAAGLRVRLGAEELARLAEAHDFAVGQHGDQTRPAGEPYTWHLLEVVEILATWLDVTDADLLTAGLMHDVVEDTDATMSDVATRFGSRVAGYVGQVTMPDAAPGQDKADVRLAYLDRLCTAPAGVVRLKLADRYSNVQRLHTHPRVAKQRSYYAETVEHFLPLSTVDARLADLFAAWAEAYDYLAEAVDGVDAADKLAAAVHREQVDKSRSPYVEHVRATARIANADGATAHQQMAALLHDAVEDTPCTLDQLRDLGVPSPVVTMVDALTRRPAETQGEYLARLNATPEAVLVKRADIEHNQSPDRLARLDPDTRHRLSAKYRAALAVLATH